MSAKGAAASAKARQARKQSPQPQPPAAQVEPGSSAAAAVLASQVELVAEEISRIRAILAPTHRSDRCPTCKRAFSIDARDRAALVKSLDVLLDRQRILAGIPLPGSLKPAKPRESTRPTEWDGLPQAAAPAAPIVLPPAAGTGTTG